MEELSVIFLNLENNTMTKKEFKTICSHQLYTGRNTRINAFFFDFKQGETAEGKYYGGYKFMLYANNKEVSKAELFNWCYDIYENKKLILDTPVCINFKLAGTNESRFKIPLSLKNI
jgi:hypothetical protein